MALTERTEVDKYEIVGSFKHLQCREAVVIERDGQEISRTFSRFVIAPGDDVSNQSAEIQAICAAVHTQDVIDAYQAHLASSQLGE